MNRYTDEFRRNAIERMKQIGITKASRELKVAHCTIYRWCRELEGSNPGTEAPANEDLNTILEKQAENSKQSALLTEDDAEVDSPETGDTIAAAMAVLVIENAHLREVIKHLRDTISGLSDHALL